MTKPITSSAWRGQSGKLSAQLLSRRELILYGQSDRPAARLVDRAYRRIAGGVSRGARTTSLRDRSRRDPPGSPAHDLDPARWRCGFRHPLAPDQKRLFACSAPRGTDLRRPRRQRRARDLAAALLGAYAARRGRLVRHLDYLHFNQVKHGHAVRVRDWPFSSFCRWVQARSLSARLGRQGWR